MKTIIQNYVKLKENYFKSENIETGKVPSFIVSARLGNDRESLNLYFDYMTSKKTINRAIYCVGPADQFSGFQAINFERFAANALNDLGIAATSFVDWKGK